MDKISCPDKFKLVLNSLCEEYIEDIHVLKFDSHNNAYRYSLLGWLCTSFQLNNTWVYDLNLLRYKWVMHGKIYDFDVTTCKFVLSLFGLPSVKHVYKQTIFGQSYQYTNKCTYYVNTNGKYIDLIQCIMHNKVEYIKDVLDLYVLEEFFHDLY